MAVDIFKEGERNLIEVKAYNQLKWLLVRFFFLTVKYYNLNLYPSEKLICLASYRKVRSLYFRLCNFLWESIN